jgi:hypothetical protein
LFLSLSSYLVEKFIQKFLLFLPSDSVLQKSDSLFKQSYSIKDITKNLSLYKQNKSQLFMQQQELKMPVPCLKCGELFDLAYDAESSSLAEEIEYELENPKKTKALCWVCRG